MKSINSRKQFFPSFWEQIDRFVECDVLLTTIMIIPFLNCKKNPCPKNLFVLFNNQNCLMISTVKKVEPFNKY